MMKNSFKKTLSLCVAVAFCVLLLAGCGGSGSSAPPATTSAEAGVTTDTGEASGWKPTETVEFICPYGAGGGSDVYARVLAEYLQTLGIVEQPIVVVNKTGGSGAVGMGYLADQKGKSNVICTMIAGQISNPIANDLPVKVENLTPIANIAQEDMCFVALTSAQGDKFSTIEEFIEYAQANPQKINVGAVSTANEDQMTFAMLDKLAGNTMNYVSFDGAGDVMTALLGGHVDMAIFNPSEYIGQLDAGTVYTLATMSEERIWDDVPTMIEISGDSSMVFKNIRGILGPPDMPAEALKFWSDAFQQVAEDPDFQEKYLKDRMLEPYFLNSDDALSFYNSQRDIYTELLKDLGFIV